MYLHLSIFICHLRKYMLKTMVSVIQVQCHRVDSGLVPVFVLSLASEYPVKILGRLLLFCCAPVSVLMLCIGNAGHSFLIVFHFELTLNAG